MDDLKIPQRVFVTGGRGSLATIVDSFLVAAGAEVTKFSRTPGEGFHDLAELAEPGRLHECDALLHLAWSTVPYSAEQAPGAEERVDLPLLRRLLGALAEQPRQRRPHFVFFSSGGTIYGNARDGRPHRETDRCAPIGRHGMAKLAAERIIEEEGNRHGLSWTTLRISNPYGFPVPAGRRQGIIPVAIQSAREGRALQLWGDGTARKDFLHYSDFGTAVARVVQARPAGTYNLAAGESHTIGEVLDAVEQATGHRLERRHVPAYPWDVHDSLLDNSRLTSALGWRPLVSLAEGVRRTAMTPAHA